VDDKSVLITGAAGGLGGATAMMFAERGWRVFAADLEPPSAAPGVVPLSVDITDAESVRAAVAAVKQAAPEGLDAVVTFAGVMLVAPLVEVAESDLRRIIDVNVLGTYRVVKEAFPLIHLRQGRVITISSETGWQKALMLNGPYAMTKHAIEAYSDALRRELMFLDIPVSIIEPGPFQTGMVAAIEAAFERAASASTYFPDLIRRVGKLAALEQSRAHPPDVLAAVVWQAATAARPKPRYSVRPDLRRTLLHRMPDRLADFALKRMLR
jgi:NAD(P)-dependent dehydrogenase (short-subunit alcohol dehydrogenase family)